MQPLEPFLSWHTAISFELTEIASTAPFRVVALLLRLPQVRRKTGDRSLLLLVPKKRQKGAINVLPLWNFIC
jgi:hypothetical protein